MLSKVPSDKTEAENQLHRHAEENDYSRIVPSQHQENLLIPRCRGPLLRK